MKLELKHLAPYLPYGLKVEWAGLETEIFSINPNYGTVKVLDREKEPYNTAYERIKPILRPLSDLSKDIDLELEEFIVIGGEKFYEPFDVDFESLNYEKITWFLKHHFDVFGLIEKGLAIDINTLN